MPVCLNENKFTALQVANGSLFEAVGIVPNPSSQVFSCSATVRIHVGNPLGIILQSDVTKAFRFPNIPPGTVLIPSQKHSVETHDKKTCQRIGLPCTPGFALTDFKSQGKNLENAILGLYGRADRRQDGTLDKCEFTSLYVQLSRCKTLQGIQLLKPVNVEDFVAIRPG
jgi:hypothetical protein